MSDPAFTLQAGGTSEKGIEIYGRIWTRCTEGALVVSRRNYLLIDWLQAKHEMNKRLHLARCLCGKVRFRDKKEAIQALHHIQLVSRYQRLVSGTTKRQECRTYSCEICNGYHLTSQPDLALNQKAQRNCQELGSSATNSILEPSLVEFV